MGESAATKAIYDKVEGALQSIRPYLEADGGDVKLLSISEGGIVKLELLGACGTCPMSTMTLQAGVEVAIKRAVPEINSVEAINITSPTDPEAKLPSRYI